MIYTIKWRAVIVFFTLTIVSLSAVIIYVSNTQKKYMFDKEKTTLTTNTNIIGTFVLEAHNENRDISSIQGMISSSSYKQNRIIVTNPDGLVLFDSNEADSLKDKLFLVNASVRSALSGKELANIIEDNNEYYAEACSPVTLNKEIKYAVYISRGIPEITEALNDTMYNLIIISIIISLIIGFTSYYLSREITKPIANIVSVTNEIAKGDFDIRINRIGKSELSILAKAINSMSAQIGELEEKRKTFVADASHELKTPLASIKLMCDSLLQSPDIDAKMQNEFLRDINSETERLSKIIDQLLLLNTPYNTKSQTKFHSLSEILAEVIIRNKKIAEKNNITLSHEIENDIFFKCEDNKIWAVFYNIISNAIKYTEPGGKVFASLENKAEKIVFSVKDNGIGIKDEDKEKIFERFYRVDKARTRDTGGTGLGLAIVKDIINNYGGDIVVLGDEGKGSEFVITLPAQKGGDRLV